MDNTYGRTGTTGWFLFLLINALSFQVLFVDGDGGQHIAQNMEEKPPLAKLVMGTLTAFKNSHKNSWDKIKAIVHGLQLQFFPPNLDFRGEDQGVNKGGGGTQGRMKDAAENSFEVSKITAEESAKSAAKVVGETVDKVKAKLSNDDESHQHNEL